MTNLIPKYYYKDVFEINYAKLKKDMIKCLLFDLDNTLAPVNVSVVDKRFIELINDLKKDFKVVLISNALPMRTKKNASVLGVDYVALSWKPHKFVYNKILKKYGFDKNDVACVGDQLFTDIKGANNAGLTSILVDPLSDVDSIFTKKNRKNENKYMNNNDVIKRGKYYE